jgi:hypothetical protein
VSDAHHDRQRNFHDVALRWLPDVTRFARSLTREDAATEDPAQGRGRAARNARTINPLREGVLARLRLEGYNGP